MSNHFSVVPLEVHKNYPIFSFGNTLKEMAPDIKWSIINKPLSMIDCHVAEICRKSLKSIHEKETFFEKDWLFKPTVEEWEFLRGRPLFNKLPKNIPSFYTKEGIGVLLCWQDDINIVKNIIKIITVISNMERDDYRVTIPSVVRVYTPSEIGEKLGGMSAIKVNSILEQLGLQTCHLDKGGYKRWTPTQVGYNYTSFGGKYWDEEVIILLKDLLEDISRA